MNHLNSAREHITSAFQATGENQMRSSLRLAQVHAQIASAEAQTRIAECLETLVEDRTPVAGDPVWFGQDLGRACDPDETIDAAPDPLADLAPDWSQAPDWAQWYAVDEDGLAAFFEHRPFGTNDELAPAQYWVKRGGKCARAGKHHAPVHVDWTRLIWQRPQAQEAARPDWLPEWRGG